MTTQDVSGLLELAERCEQATGPDRKIDTAITFWMDKLGILGAHEIDADNLIIPPNFTASLDAAMTLVPKGWYVGEWVESPDRDTSWVTLVPAEDEGVERSGKSDTAPLALCAAALRARASTDRKE